MSTEENKAIVRRDTEEVWHKGNLSIIPEIIDPNYVYHAPSGMEFKGPEGFRQMVTIFRTAFPDMRFTIEDMVAEGDMVAVRITDRGTHKGEFMGIAPTGKKVTMTEAMFIRFEGDKEVEAWGCADMLGMMQQLGVVPPMGQGGG